MLFDAMSVLIHSITLFVVTFWCFDRRRQIIYFRFFFLCLTYVGNFSIALLPNWVVIKEPYLHKEDAYDGLLPATFTT